MGVGLLIAVSADILVISRSALLGMPEVKLGIDSDVASLRRFLPDPWIRRMCLSGQTFTAADLRLDCYAGATVCEPGTTGQAAAAVLESFSGVEAAFLERAKRRLAKHLSTVEQGVGAAMSELASERYCGEWAPSGEMLASWAKAELAVSVAYLVDGVRTPIGRYGGALSAVRPDDLAAHVLRVLRSRHPSVDWPAVDDVILGCVNQAGEDNRNVARMALLLAGLPDTVSGATVNRLCGSGADAVATAARSIRAGEADLVVAGGVESMSRAPFVIPKAASPFARTAEIYDTTMGWRFVNPAFHAVYGTHGMGETAEIVAEERGVSRADQDAFALRSQQRAAKAAGGRVLRR